MIVLKFGGASLSHPEKFKEIAQIIISRKRSYSSIVVVVSAMGETTNHLLKLANMVNTQPSRREQDMLISIGERASISLLAMALQKLDVEAISFTGSQSGIITCENHCDAKIIDIRPKRIFPHLENGRVVIVAGFQGVSVTGEITTLGRGGSDTTAVALAVSLKADHVEFYKDVDGVYTHDPKFSKDAKKMYELSFAEAKQIAENGRILNKRSIELAEKNQIPLWVGSYKNFNESKRGTWIEKDAKRTGSIVYEKDLNLDFSDKRGENGYKTPCIL